MKKLTKWISLLMAGLMVSATLASCDSGYDWSEEDADDKEEQADTSKYKNLDPDDVADAILEADKFTISVEIHTGSASENITRKLNYMKNGDLIWGSSKTTSATYNTAYEVYADLKAGLLYTQEDGVWVTEEEETDLNEILDDVLYDDLLLENDSYLEFDSDTGRYPLKEEALREELGVSENTSVEGYMTRKGGEYTFFFSITNESGNPQTCTITVKFTADKISLPEVEESTNGNEGTAVPSPMPDVQN